MPRSATGRATNGLPQLLIHFRPNRRGRSPPGPVRNGRKAFQVGGGLWRFRPACQGNFRRPSAAGVSPLADSASMSYAIAYG